MYGLKKSVLLIVLPLFAFTAVHKFYVSVTNVVYSEKHDSLQITTRIFIDDLEAVLTERYGVQLQLATDRESKSANTYIEKYVRAKFAVQRNGKTVPFDFLGKKYDADVIICYIEVPQMKITDLKSLTIENEILTDMFDEQNNVVHCKIGKERKSFVLTKTNIKGMLNF